MCSFKQPVEKRAKARMKGANTKTFFMVKRVKIVKN
jgi:hypothetical protein